MKRVEVTRDMLRGHNFCGSGIRKVENTIGIPFEVTQKNFKKVMAAGLFPSTLVSSIEAIFDIDLKYSYDRVNRKYRKLVGNDEDESIRRECFAQEFMNRFKKAWKEKHGESRKEKA